jgi:hypothetical protein
MRFLCGHDYVAHRLKNDPGLARIVDSWREQTSCYRPLDKAAAQAATSRIYARLGLPLPDVRWWLSPIAMLLAHDTKIRGIRWVERHHGKVAMQSSSEYLEWLETGDRSSVSGKAIGERACTCDYYGSTLSMLDCIQHRSMCRSKLDSAKMRDVEMFSGFCFPYFRVGSEVRDVLESALLGMLEPDGRVADLALFRKGSSEGERGCFWAMARHKDFLRADLQEYLAGGLEGDNCLHAYRELAKHCHVAVLRDGLCWLCVDPELMRFGEEVDPYDPDNLVEVRYRDGTHLYGVDGTAMTEEAFLSPTSFGLKEIDGPEANPWRREALLRRYGVKRYLEALNATLVDERRQDRVDERLWRVVLADESVVTFFERSYIDLFDKRVFNYRELPGKIGSFLQADILQAEEDSFPTEGAGHVAINDQPR